MVSLTVMRRCVAFVATMALVACGGGGGGSTPPPPPASLILSGKAPAPDGTAVELLRADAAGAPGMVLASAPVTVGGYRFDLTALGLVPASDLMLRVTPPGAPPLRALAAATSVDIAPGTEAFVQWVRQRIAAVPGAGLTGLTAVEAAGLQGSALLLALFDEAASGPAASVQAAVDRARDRLSANARFETGLAAALDPAVSLDGPGDLLDLAPLRVGARRVYEVVESGATPRQEALEVRAGAAPGTFDVVDEAGSVDTYVSRADGVYTVPGAASGVDELLAAIGEYPVLDFPPVPGRERVVKSGSGVAVGDQDGDGRPEAVDFVFRRAERGVVPTAVAGVLHGLEVLDTADLTLRYSSGIVVTALATTRIVFSPGVGPALEDSRSTASAPGIAPVETSETRRLVAWFEPPVAIPLVHRRVVFDPRRRAAHASIPATGGSFAERVVTLDLDTRQVSGMSPPFPAGSDPDRLVLADDGQSLYVSLAGAGAIARLALPSLALLESFPLAQGADLNAPWRAVSMATTPALPGIVAVSLVDPLGASQGIAAYGGGVRLPDRGGCAFATSGDTCRLAFASGRLLALDDNTTRNTLTLNIVTAPSALGPGGVRIERSVEAPDIVASDASGRFWNGLSEPSPLATRLLAPDAGVYDAGTLERRGLRPDGQAGCIALTRGGWFVCRDTLQPARLAFRELGADDAQRVVASVGLPALSSRSARLVALGEGRLGISDAVQETATVFDRLLLVEGGPF